MGFPTDAADAGPSDLGPGDAGPLAVITDPVLPESLSISEGETRRFSIYLSRAPERDLPATLSVSSTAALSVDITAHTFTAANYATPVLVSFSAPDDDDAVDTMASLTITVQGFAPRTYEILIADNDVLAIVTSTGAVALDEGTTATITVALLAQPTSSVSVSILSSDLGAAVPVPGTLVFGPRDWRGPKPLRVEALADRDVRDEALRFDLTAAGCPRPRCAWRCGTTTRSASSSRRPRSASARARRSRSASPSITSRATRWTSR